MPGPGQVPQVSGLNQNSDWVWVRFGPSYGFDLCYRGNRGSISPYSTDQRLRGRGGKRHRATIKIVVEDGEGVRCCLSGRRWGKRVTTVRIGQESSHLFEWRWWPMAGGSGCQGRLLDGLTWRALNFPSYVLYSFVFDFNKISIFWPILLYSPCIFVNKIFLSITLTGWRNISLT